MQPTLAAAGRAPARAARCHEDTVRIMDESSRAPFTYLEAAVDLLALDRPAEEPDYASLLNEFRPEAESGPREGAQ